MKRLEDKILSDGMVYPGRILKVDSFLNHQIDVELLDEMGAEFYRLFQKKKITKIITIEASGIAIACMAARYFHVPLIFAKKARSMNLGNEVYTSLVHSYTYDKDYHITISKNYLNKDDTVLLIDDFLANGQAMRGLVEICKQAEVIIAGIGICIEKGFQSGGKELRDLGYDVQSLAVIQDMSDHELTFAE